MKKTKVIGLLGGIGWASTLEYYRLINEMTTALMGDAHSAEMVLVSMNQFDFTSRASMESPAAIEDFLVSQGGRLKAAGADFFLFCANGVHRFDPAVTPRIDLPFISIVDETAKQVVVSGIKTVGLLGVKQTMSGHFYHQRLEQQGIDVVTPNAADQEIVHEIIYTELVHNRISARSRITLLRIMDDLMLRGAGGVILGCTELPLIISPADTQIALFNTTEIHCRAAVVQALEIR